MKNIGNILKASVLSILALASPLLPFDETAAGLSGIQVSFKLDPRLMGGTYGGDRWVRPTTYIGTNGQDTVDVRAQVVDAKGKLISTSPEWVPSDLEMVMVSPAKGDQVKITVKRAGESLLKVAAQGFSKELVIKAKYMNRAIQVEITQPAAKKTEVASAPVAVASVFKSQKEKLSYAVGVNLVNALQKQSVEADERLLIQGIKDALSGGKTFLTTEEVRATLLAEQSELKSKAVAFHGGMKELAEKNKKDGETFLAENMKKEGVVTRPSGLQYKILKAGDGKRPGPNDTVVCRYRGTLIDGTEFYSSYKRYRPARFSPKRLTKGWAEALQLMPVGSKWRIYVPPDLAYGQRGSLRNGIGPNATLIFEVDLLSIQDASGESAQVSEQMKDQGPDKQATGL